MSEQEGLEGRIAIIGMAGRFPGANTVAEFWRNLREGAESTTFFADGELDDWFDSAVRNAPNFVRARPIIANADKFDATFFNMNAREAELTDPQHRIFLECAWEALEDAGYDHSAFDGDIGVFAGCSMNTYFLNNICSDRSFIEAFTSNFQVGDYSTLLGAGREFLATRVSYKLGLKGPSVTVQTACSTSLVAVVQACQSLQLYQADLALAGGVSITFPQHRGYQYQEGGMVSADGRCRPFDASATGTIFGSGAGVVLLKRLSEAIADRDHIYGVILGGCVNNDGASKVGFTAPSVDGQAAAIEHALAQSNVDARTVSYVECHGTATPLGDPIEIAGLTKAYRKTTDERQYCRIGSVKGNIGHLDAAAGVAGLIKATLMLKNRRFVPSIHFSKPNPQIDFGTSPFFVGTDERDWPSGPEPRRAGVSSLGVGGTNAHVVLEEAPIVPSSAEENGVDVARPHLLVLSARSPAALAERRSRLSEHLRLHTDASVADVAFTLAKGRRHFSHRLALVAGDREHARALLAATDSPRVHTGEATTAPPPIVFMFPGQGAQYPNMAADLYRRFPVFRREIERCDDILRPLGVELINALYGPSEAVRDELLALTGTAQPAIFAVEYSLAQLWQSWGIEPRGFIGHSVGEFVAACLAGVFELPDALRLVAARGRLMEAQPRGGMTAIRLPEEQVAPLLGSSISLAAINSPSHCVVAGPIDALEDIEHQLGERGAAFRRLHTSHAFHSAMMDPIIAPFADLVSKVQLAEPKRPYVSGVTGDWIRAEEATSPEYWAKHAREPVRFAAGIKTWATAESPILLEVGPGTTLATLALQTVRSVGGRIVSSLPDATGQTSDDDSLLEALGKLWIAGHNFDWDAIVGKRSRVPLPTYPFERRRYWVDAPSRNASKSGVVEPVEGGAQLHASVEGDPLAKEQDMTATPQNASSPKQISDADASGIRAGIGTILEEVSGESVVSASASATFLEMGFDSLLLSQVAQRLEKRFKVKVAFRQLLGELSTISTLASFIGERSPTVPAIQRPKTEVPPAASAPVQPGSGAALRSEDGGAKSSIESIMRAQVDAMSQLIQQQLVTLQQVGLSADPSVAKVEREAPASPPAVFPPPAALETEQRPSRFQVYRPVQKSGDGLTESQREHIGAFAARYIAKTAGSKRLTATYRPVLADPRAAAGFRAEWKELVYPIVCSRADGSRIWDVDGNEYIDLVNGYGQTMFGHAPKFVVDAVKEQLDKGFAIGPQAEFAGEIAALFTEITGNERMTFCNTGSEAVMAALRIARAVTGRTKVVLFSGAYHGQFDEVLVKGSRRSDGSRRSVAIAAGIPASAVENIVVLDYATSDSLKWVRDNGEDLAAVVVEPVQSRHPGLQPFDFLRELRDITAAAGIVFVMDEIVTGFRVHPGGMQAVTGIRADLVTYGKVVGGGLPIGILAGKAKFMDALDGGAWNYGDDSVPEVGVTFFAGTFVRHPLALAALRAVLMHLKAHGPDLQDQIGARAATLAKALDQLFPQYGLAAKVECFSSFLYFSLYSEHPLAGLLFHHLRDRGIHVQEGFPIFLTTAHTDADLAKIMAAFRDSLDEMVGAGIFVQSPTAVDAAGKRSVPLTESQIEIWLAAQMGEAASCAFNESVTLRLIGPLDEVALGAALAQVVARHDALRMRFSATGEEMWVEGEGHIQYTADLTFDGSSPESRLAAYTATDARTPFDLVNGPAARAHLIKLAQDSHALVFTAHHIVCDGWSINVIVDELTQSYRALCQGRSSDLSAPPSFSAYANAQQSREESERSAVEAYWLEQYAKPARPIDLPTDRPRPSLKSYAGATQCRRISKDLYRAVKGAGAREGCTLFVTLLAAFEMLMGRLTGVEDLVVGIPTAGQSLAGDIPLVGHCVNFLPVRGSWTEQTTLADHLRAVSKQVLDAYEHQDYTLGTLVRKLAAPRETNRMPLTEIQFNLERLADRIEAAGVTIDVEPNPKANVNFDVFWNVIESQEGLRIDCDYNTDLFDAATIDRWLESYEVLLSAISSNTSQAVTRVPFVPPAEMHRLVVDLNNSTAEYPRDLCVHDLIEARVSQRPDATAVMFGESTLSYRELDERANQLANHLVEKIGKRGGRIGVLVERSPEMLVALLATWKAGCAYVPLDPSHPVERLRYILSDADVSALVTDHHLQELPIAPGAVVVDLHGEREAIADRPKTSSRAPSATAVATAYLIYTSGSTGRPKGVEVTHRSLVNLLVSMARRPGATETDVLLAVTTIAFDIAALELFLPLIVGAKVAIAPRHEAIDGHKLMALLHATKATLMQATPASWELLLEAGFQSRAGFTMLCGGEALRRDLADRLLAGGGTLWNMYGPTETTVWSSCAEIRLDTAPITIGQPIANTQLQVLDKYDQPAPVGAIGELCIGGDGVARGYFKREDLTTEKFGADPFGLSPRLYRTGDVARRRPDGEIQLLGRVDHQIKLRGYRIELAEIENVLIQGAGVTAAAAALREDTPGTPLLVGYIVEREGPKLTDEELRAHVAQRLPDYMVPALWVRLENLPISPNGKLDRTALLAPAPSSHRQNTFEAPVTPLETALASIWSEVLKLDRVGRNDELFRIGADSLQLFQIAARANRTGIRVSVRQLLNHRTVASLAAALGQAGAASEDVGPQERETLRHFQKSRRGGAD